MPEYKCSWLKRMVKDGIIEFIDYDVFKSEIVPKIEKLQIKPVEEGKAWIYFLYFTGCRPSEMRYLKTFHVEIQEDKIKIMIPTTKHGRARLIILPMKYDEVKFLAEFFKKQKEIHPREQPLFPYLHRRVKDHNVCDAIRYRLRSCGLKDIVPYVFRHNRFSLLAFKGAKPEEIKYFKGARTLSSVEPYLHISKLQAEELAELI